MNALRSPAFVGLLAALAVLVAGWNVVRPTLGRMRARSSTPAQPSSPAPAAAQSAISVHAAPAVPTGIAAPPLDFAAVSLRFREWLDTPARDPFQALAPPQVGPRAEDMLVVKAIWRQAGSALAVINGMILQEGDQILGFKLERIEGDVVWVSSVHGMESVAFGPERPVAERHDAESANPQVPVTSALPAPAASDAPSPARPLS